MIDFHTHILPNIDDGSRSVDMSLAMLAEEATQGVTTVVATPHFYAQDMSMEDFLERRENALVKVKEKMSKSGSSYPAILAGAEVYYFSGMGLADEVSMLTVEGTNTLLLEMPFGQWSSRVFENVEQLINRQNLTLVLAHVERYFGYQNDKSIWDEIFALPVIPQINSGSLIEKRRLFRRDKTYEFCIEFAKKAEKLILGSDCHNLSDRKPNLKAGRAALEAALGSSASAMTDKTVREVLGEDGN